jgi:hypothetical protein
LICSNCSLIFHPPKRFTYKKIGLSSRDSGRKAFLPRYHPQFAIFGAAYPVQTHHRSITRSHVQPYYIFRRQLQGESPALHASGFHQPALSDSAKPTQGSPFIAFQNIFVILTHGKSLCKDYLSFLTKNKGHDMVLLE